VRVQWHGTRLLPYYTPLHYARNSLPARPTP